MCSMYISLCYAFKKWVTPSLYMFKYITGKKFHENGLIGYDDVNLKF